MWFLSLFSGIEAASLAWQNLGWKTLAVAEVAPFPSAVIRHHFPHVPNLGDVREIDYGRLHPFDLVVGGSPCQDFSLAGTRAGLDGERSVLAREFVRCLAERRPRWFVWENVPGAFSTNKGEDFKSLVEAFEECGYGVAWRVLDAQFFGVPQRRRRLFVVGHFGDWRPSVAVLFEPEGVRGASETGEGAAAGSVEGDVGEATCWDWHRQTHELRPLTRVSNTVAYRWGSGGDNMPFLLDDQGGQHITVAGQLAPTLRAQTHGHEPCVCGPFVRKMTPVECERLMGFPDGWTDVPWRGKEHSPKGARFCALGNSMAVPVMRWLGRRIDLVHTLLYG